MKKGREKKGLIKNVEELMNMKYIRLRVLLANGATVVPALAFHTRVR